jgi:hypothetical protein
LVRPPRPGAPEGCPRYAVQPGPGWVPGLQKMIAALARGDYEQAAKEMKDSKWYWEVGNRSRRLVKMMVTGHDYDPNERFDLTK